MDTNKEMSDNDKGEFRQPVDNNGEVKQTWQDHDSDEENANNEYANAEPEKNEKVKNGTSWKKYSENVSKSVLLEKLRDATKKRQERKLAEALNDCETAGIEDNDDVDKAEYVLGVIQVQQELLALLDEKDAKHIEQEFDAIKRTYARYLDDAQWEQSQVRQHLWFLKEGVKYRTAYDKRVLSLSPSVISEIRRYKQPTSTVHTIVQAALLLFGESESQTKVWSYCQKCLNPQGSSSLVSRMIDFEVKDVHSEIAARADEMIKLLLKDLEANDGSEDNIRSSSPSAFTLYVWTQGVIEERRKLADDQDESWKPARLKPQPSRQLAILEEQQKEQQLKQRQAAQQQKEAAAANSPRSKSPRRNYTNNAGKQTNQKPKASTKKA